jgi:hypothetical protein
MRGPAGTGLGGDVTRVAAADLVSVARQVTSRLELFSSPDGLRVKLWI